jgi:hypothetical protein
VGQLHARPVHRSTFVELLITYVLETSAVPIVMIFA